MNKWQVGRKGGWMGKNGINEWIANVTSEQTIEGMSKQTSKQMNESMNQWIIRGKNSSMNRLINAKAITYCW